MNLVRSRYRLHKLAITPRPKPIDDGDRSMEVTEIAAGRRLARAGLSNI